MATHSFTTKIRHDSDAEFRAWGSAFSGALTAIGLTNTADTGQINWTTVVRAGTNAYAGYEIWRFNDTAHATRPIFLKIEYGTGSTVNRDSMRITIGTGSDGAGTLTGVVSVASVCGNNGSSDLTSETAYPSYFCYNATLGAFWFSFKEGSNGYLGFWITRTCDSDGNGDTVGISATWSGNSVNSYTRRICYKWSTAYLTTATTATNGGITFIPMNSVSSTDGADTAVYLCWTYLPAVAPLNSICMSHTSEILTGSTFLTTLVGTTQRTYICVSVNLGVVTSSNSIGMQGAPCLIWE